MVIYRYTDLIEIGGVENGTCPFRTGYRLTLVLPSCESIVTMSLDFDNN